MVAVPVSPSQAKFLCAIFPTDLWLFLSFPFIASRIIKRIKQHDRHQCANKEFLSHCRGAIDPWIHYQNGGFVGVGRGIILEGVLLLRRGVVLGLGDVNQPTALNQLGILTAVECYIARLFSQMEAMLPAAIAEFEEAQKALDTLGKADLVALKNFAKPPQPIATLACILSAWFSPKKGVAVLRR